MRIKKVRKDQASVDFLDPRGAPIRRSYMKGTPSVNMVARYDDYHETFEVDLWEEGKEFMLDLTHEYNYKLDSERREALVPALTRYERDWFLDEHYSLFGPLEHVVRRRAQKKTAATQSSWPAAKN